MARSRGTTVGQVIGYLEAEGHRVLKWAESAARADNLRRAALKDEAEHPGIQEAAMKFG